MVNPMGSSSLLIIFVTSCMVLFLFFTERMKISINNKKSSFMGEIIGGKVFDVVSGIALLFN